MDIENRDGRLFICDVDVTSFTTGERDQYLAAMNALESETKAIEDLASAEVARVSSAAFIIEKTLLAKERAEEVRKNLERATVDDMKYRELRTKHGRGRVGKLDTKGGMVVLRAPSDKEATEHGLEVTNCDNAADREALARQYLVRLCEHPSKEKILDIAGKWPGLWADLNGLQDRLMSARAGDEIPLD